MNEHDLLQQLIAGPASGDTLASRFGVTRAAVWKRVQGLREAGIAISAGPGRGYALTRPVDLLDGPAIGSSLSSAAKAVLARLEVAWSLDSTNAELLRREPPAAGTEVLLAERQTAGRGRRGRIWSSPLAANIYLSLSRRYAAGLARLGGLSLASGVAVADALRALGACDVRLKWPNDIVANGRKLGGLLVEGSGEPAGVARAVVGLGLNVRMPTLPENGIDQPWTDLASVLDVVPQRGALAAHLLEYLLPALDLFDREGLAPFLPGYARHDALCGRLVAVLEGNGSVRTGTALGIAEDGALRVRMEGTERRLHSGEVSVRAS